MVILLNWANFTKFSGSFGYLHDISVFGQYRPVRVLVAGSYFGRVPKLGQGAQCPCVFGPIAAGKLGQKGNHYGKGKISFYTLRLFSSPKWTFSVIGVNAFCRDGSLIMRWKHAMFFFVFCSRNGCHSLSGNESNCPNYMQRIFLSENSFNRKIAVSDKRGVRQ